jgi:hypothetical protein
MGYCMVMDLQGNKAFFNDHSFKTGYEHATEYMRRNADKSGLKLFVRSNMRTNRPKPYDSWRECVVKTG